MEKEIFETAYLERLNQNFATRSKYFDFKLLVLTDLGTIIFEINNCLILGFNRAAITLTNFLLERGLKLALIYNEAGIGPKPPETWTETFAGPSKKYNTINLSTSIDLCKKNGLLTQDERDHLYDTIRVLMRNGFAHADPSEIVKNIPDENLFSLDGLTVQAKFKKSTLTKKSFRLFSHYKWKILPRRLHQNISTLFTTS